MKKIYLITLLSLIIGCQGQREKSEEAQDIKDIPELLYYQCDTVIRKADSMILVNKRFDTTIIETGIFADLRYDFELSIDREFTNFIRQADTYKAKGSSEEAKQYFKKGLSYYHNERIKVLMAYSDLNMIRDYEESASILCSYIHENLGHADSAIIVLEPYLQTQELYGARTLERYRILRKIKN